jgi:hypothetical protein
MPLRELHMERCDITNLRLPQLTHLTCINCKSTDISGLPALEQLEYCDMNLPPPAEPLEHVHTARFVNCNLSYLNMPRLRNLHIQGGSVRSYFEMMRLLPELDRLHLDGVHSIAKSDFLAYCPVRRLEVKGAGEVDIRFLVDVEVAVLHGTSIPQESFENMRGLRHLYMEDCSGITDLNKLQQLRLLSLTKMNVRTTAISRLRALEELHLRDVPNITSIRPLVGLKRLRTDCPALADEVPGVELC